MDNCFIIMPISTPDAYINYYMSDQDHFKHVLDHLFVPAIKKTGLNVIPPIVEGSDVIHAKIINNIEKADMVLCDMSTLNPNVFFELGIRVATNKPVCMVKDNVTNQIPFDTSIINYHTYDSSLSPWKLEKEVDVLSKHLKKGQESGNNNSMWRYFSLSSQANFVEEGTGLEAKINLIELQLRGLAEKLISKGKDEEVALLDPERQTMLIDLDNEVRDMLKKFTPEIKKGQLDYHRLFEMTKQKLIKERGIKF